MSDFHHTLPILGLGAFWCAVLEGSHRFIPVPKYVSNQKTTHKQKRKDFLFYASRWVGMLHGAVSAYISFKAVYHYGYEFARKNEAPFMFPIYWSLTYFFVDGVFGFVKKYEELGTIVHHMITVSALGSVLYLGEDASGLVLMLGMGEITSPLLSLMEFVKYFQWRPPLSVVIQLSFVFSFFVMRGPGAYIYFIPMFSSESHFLMKSFIFGIWVISMNYVWIVINMAIKIGHQMIPNNKLLAGAYKVCLKLRPFRGVYLGLVGLSMLAKWIPHSMK